MVIPETLNVSSSSPDSPIGMYRERIESTPSRYAQTKASGLLDVTPGDLSRRNIFRKIFLLLATVFGFFNLNAQSRWSFELQFGVVQSLDLPLVFYQHGYPEIRLNKADYYSEPLNDPPYWNWRFSRWKKKKSIEFEAVHHKFFLKNPPPGVEMFQVTHGYNMLFLNRGWEVGKYIVRAGLGTGLVHPESRVRGLYYEFGSGLDLPGYRIRGITANLSGARQFPIGKYFFVNAEAKIHASVANIDIVNGHARMHTVVFQLILGPGVNWAVKEEGCCE